VEWVALKCPTDRTASENTGSPHAPTPRCAAAAEAATAAALAAAASLLFSAARLATSPADRAEDAEARW
jgi:hypothetical protein